MKIFNILIFIFVTLSFYSQSIVKGFVYNSNNRPLEDVNVSVNGKMDHTHTNAQGMFELEANIENDTLLISREGYLPMKIILTQESTKDLIVNLLDDVFFLESVDVNASTSVMNQVVNVDLTNNTKTSSQELLTLVPGLFVAQHAGGGKSEQMFLRGFDLDHGTDINITLDNMPVNMVSHAHGQGYTDLHFVMPELIEKVDFDKGPYELQKGNFATAGYVNFKTKDYIEKNQVSIGYGSFNSKVISGVFNLLKKENKANAYVAASLNKSDGYFETSQYLTRVNVFGKYSNFIQDNVKLNLSASFFESDWNASGQVPMRSVNDGSITRFGAIDNTEGGNTSRKNIQAEMVAYLPKDGQITTSLYYTQNEFELYSNFTFFNRDSINGDQIRQRENRNMYGFNIDYKKLFRFGETDLTLKSGLGLRIDDVNEIELSYTKNRITTLENVQLGNLDEANYFAYIGSELTKGKFVFHTGIRAEEIVHRYENLLDSNYRPQEKTLYAVLPKVLAKYNINKNISVFAKWGQGFHSNDSRLVLNSSELEYLPLANSYDFGVDIKPVSNLIINAAIWHMTSQQEFVYVGDEGVVDLSGSSIRKGVDLGVSYQPFKYVSMGVNANYNHARSKTDENEFVPLAAPFTATGNIQFRFENGFRFNWNTRIMGDRPADELNSVIAKGYVNSDVGFGYYKSAWNISAICSNIFNTEWNETQFLTESKLKSESEPVEEIHFTPGTPIGIKVKFSYLF